MEPKKAPMMGLPDGQESFKIDPLPSVTDGRTDTLQ